MAGKCEHGLTTRECMVCASPKYGAEPGNRWVTIPRARLTALEAAESATARVVATYDAYRRRGVSPAPVEYSQVVEAIEDARDVLGPNVEFSGVPAGHSSNRPAGGTSAATQG